MSDADMHGRESWEWPVHKALWACQDTSAHPHCPLEAPEELCKNIGVHTPPLESESAGLGWGPGLRAS